MRAKGTATFNSLDQQILGQRRIHAYIVKYTDKP
jgi:hypothetical protein